MEDRAQYGMDLQKQAKGSGALVEVEQQRAIAETQAAMIIAKRFPRDPVEAQERIINACTRPGLAETAIYNYARGGTDISGPSIRLAEAIAQHWGNLQFGIRELDQHGGSSTIEAFAWDLETNTKQIKIFQVEHFRYKKGGGYKLEDPRDIYEMVANQGARRMRACVLGIIPGDVVEAAVKQCETTLLSKAEVTPERLQSLLEKFAAHGVTKAQIEKRIQRRVDTMTPGQLINLGKIYNSLKDGMSAPKDWFEAVEPVGVTGQKLQNLKQPSKSEPETVEAPGDPEAPKEANPYEDRRSYARKQPADLQAWNDEHASRWWSEASEEAQGAFRQHYHALTGQEPPQCQPVELGKIEREMAEIDAKQTVQDIRSDQDEYERLMDKILDAPPEIIAAAKHKTGIAMPTTVEGAKRLLAAIEAEAGF